MIREREMHLTRVRCLGRLKLMRLICLGCFFSKKKKQTTDLNSKQIFLKSKTSFKVLKSS